MTTKDGFTLMTIEEFEGYINDPTNDPNRVIRNIQNHCTASPSYVDFDGNNHFEKQQGMKNYHVNQRGFSDIGQNWTTFPDGMIMTGRPMSRKPATCRGANAGGIGIEHLGHFDKGRDVMTDAQRSTIIRMNAILCKRFELTPNLDSLIYHHWYDQDGTRVGESSYKTCPGTNFFGGNKEADAETYFYPLILSEMNAVNEMQTVEPSGIAQVNDVVDRVDEQVDKGLGKVVFWNKPTPDNFDTSLSFSDRMKALILLLSGFFLLVWGVRFGVLMFKKEAEIV